MSGINRRTRTNFYFAENKVMKMDELYKYSVAIFIYKYRNEKLPPVFKNFLPKNSDSHSRVTRNADEYRIPITTCKVGEQFLKKTAVVTWNEIKKVCPTNVSIGIFKSSVQAYLFMLYE